MSNPEHDPEAREVIANLGGNAKTAQLCEVTPSAVSQWLTNGIPRAQKKYLKAVRPDAFPGMHTKKRRRIQKVKTL